MRGRRSASSKPKTAENASPVAADEVDDDAFLMSVTRSSLSTAHKSWHKKYQRLIDVLKRKPTTFNMKECYEATRAIEHYNNFTRQIHKLDFEKASAVIEYIFDNDIPLGTLVLRQKVKMKSDYAIFHGMQTFFEMSDADLDLALKELPGTYQLWRHSNSIPGQYVKGAVFIKADRNERVLTVQMLQRFLPRVQSEDHPVNGRREELFGYMFKQADRYIMLLRLTGRQHLRVTFFTEVAHNQDDEAAVGCVDWMNGRVMGVDGNKPMTTSVYMERVSNSFGPDGDDKIEHLLKTINVYSENEVPPNILRKLGGEGIINF